VAKRSYRALLAALGLLLVAAAPAAAEDRQTGGPTILSEASPDAIVDALEQAGYEVEIVKDDDGDPKINSTDKSQPFGVHFYDCDDEHEHCHYVQITQGWNLKKGITLDKIDKWNSDNVWGQAYRDDEKDPWLALVINFDGGVTPEYLNVMIDWWGIIEEDYEKAIGWDKD
jgi:hypothetical protein